MGQTHLSHLTNVFFLVCTYKSDSDTFKVVNMWKFDLLPHNKAILTIELTSLHCDWVVTTVYGLWTKCLTVFRAKLISNLCTLRSLFYHNNVEDSKCMNFGLQWWCLLYIHMMTQWVIIAVHHDINASI